jgi:hypothetical protein
MISHQAMLTAASGCVQSLHIEGRSPCAVRCEVWRLRESVAGLPRIRLATDSCFWRSQCPLPAGRPRTNAVSGCTEGPCRNQATDDDSERKDYWFTNISLSMIDKCSEPSMDSSMPLVRGVPGTRPGSTRANLTGPKHRPFAARSLTYLRSNNVVVRVTTGSV